MDKDLAKLVALTAFRSSADINNLIPLLKEHCIEEEYKLFGIAIATASTEISQQVLQRIFDIYPEIKEDLEKNVQKFGRAF